MVTAPATSIGDVAPPKETRAKSEKAANDMMAVNGEVSGVSKKKSPA